MLAAAFEIHELDVVAEFGGHVDVAEAQRALHVAVLRPRLAVRREDRGRLVEVGDAVPDVVERRRHAGTDRRAVQVDRSADGLDQLEVGGAGVDERHVDDPLLGGLAVDDGDAVQRRLVRLEAVDRAERLTRSSRHATSRSSVTYASCITLRKRSLNGSHTPVLSRRHESSRASQRPGWVAARPTANVGRR